MTKLDKNKSEQIAMPIDDSSQKSARNMPCVDNADVDWFLRDSNVPFADMYTKSMSKTNSTVASDEEKRPLGSNLIHTTSSPLLPVLNAHETNMNKAKASVSLIQEEEACPNSIQKYSIMGVSPKQKMRKNSVSSVGSISSSESSSSAGGFFTKLKHKLQRNDSLSRSPTHLTSAKEYTSSKQKLSDAKVELDCSINPNNCSMHSCALDHEDPAPDYKTDNDIDDPRLREYIRLFRRDQKQNFCMKPQIHGNLIHDQNPLGQMCESHGQSSKFSSFLRRMSVSSQQMKREETPSTSKLSLDHESEELNNTPQLILQELSTMKPLKHVAFHSQTFLIDPPQQIPSRNPRKGNVDILPSGTVRINPLTEADKRAIEKSLKGQGGGLVVGGSGVLGNHGKDSKALEANDNECQNSNDTGELDVKVDEHARSLGIEKPMVFLSRRSGYKVPIKKMPLDLMYTRCCHLREILPIPAILKQIPQGSTSPLPILQLRNPNPTMIEIQTFADFIRIAPIICVSLDGVSLSIEQLKVLLGAMCAKTQLEKLSLRNTPIDSKGWTLLCWFLSRNKVINKLDITQCPPLSLNLLRKKKNNNNKQQAQLKMMCNHENRSDMDWSLFTAALIARGGIEELILTGCCITDFSAFNSLISKAITIRTFKLGLAYNQISPQQLDCVLKHWAFSKNCRGLDLGYNDLLSSRYLNTFSSYGKMMGTESMISKSQLWFLSLNATNLRFDKTFQDFFENFIVKLPELKYLDMSNNPKLFGAHTHLQSSFIKKDNTDQFNTGSERHDVLSYQTSTDTQKKKHIPNSFSHGEDASVHINDEICTFFCSRLPRFTKLARLQLDNNELSSQNLRSLFEIIPFCKALKYLSILGNHLDIHSATSLLQCLSNSPNLITVDADYLELPEMLREKVGLHSMRNLEKVFNQDMQNQNSGTSFAGKYTNTTTLADEINHLLSKSVDGKLDFNSKEVKNLVEKIQHHRSVLQDALTDLFDLQYKRNLSVEGKETLIKLLFVDSALQWALKLVDTSFIGKNESVTSSQILKMNSAEDERIDSKCSMLSKARDTIDEEHNTLLPVKLNSLPISRLQSSTNLSNLDKEEGSAMKLLRLGNSSFFSDLSSVSGEDIRQKLLSTNIFDLDTVIDNISKAKDKGIAIKEIFKNRNCKKSNAKNMSGTRDEIEDMDQRSSRSSEVHDDKLHKQGSSPETLIDGLSINDTYDEVLREFKK